MSSISSPLSQLRHRAPGRCRCRHSNRFAAVLLLVAVGTAPGTVLGARQAGDLFTTIPALDLLDGGIANIFSGWSRWCDNYCFMVADARLPHGARIVGIEIDACRDALGDDILEYGVMLKGPHEATDPATGAKFEILFSGFFNTVGCGYHRIAPSAPVEVDLFNSEVLVFVEIGTFLCGFGSAPPCPDQGSRTQALRVYYQANPDGGVVEPTKRTGVELFP